MKGGDEERILRKKKKSREGIERNIQTKLERTRGSIARLRKGENQIEITLQSGERIILRDGKRLLEKHTIRILRVLEKSNESGEVRILRELEKEIENPIEKRAKILPGLKRGMNTTESGTMRIVRKKEQGAKHIERKTMRKLESGRKSITKVRVGKKFIESGERVILN